MINGCSISRSFIKHRLCHCNDFQLQTTGDITKPSPSTVSAEAQVITIHHKTAHNDVKRQVLFILNNVNNTFHIMG